MMTRALIIVAMLLPQLAMAADLDRPYPRHRRGHYRVYVERNHVIRCTTTSFFLFSASNCGQGFDPLGVAGL